MTQTVLGSCLSKNTVEQHPDRVALRVPSTSLFHEYITHVTRRPPGNFFTVHPGSIPPFLGPDFVSENLKYSLGP